MTSSEISWCSEADEFKAALGEAGITEYLITDGGQFRARMTSLTLPHLRLSAVEEWLPRIAVVSLPPGSVRIVLPAGRSACAIYSGLKAEAGEIVTHIGTSAVHERLSGPCRWSDILLPVGYVARYGRVLAGTAFCLPPGLRRWRPSREVATRLSKLHGAAMRITETRRGLEAGAEAARGLEQELTESVIECLSGDSLEREARACLRHSEIMTRFEMLIEAHLDRKLPITGICQALKVSHRTLHACCKAHLDMSPSHYLYARRMQLARRALRRADPAETNVACVARRYGFGQPGRFAALYRARFGELPSATLKG
jgi:AraC-like DNA-binding protein